MPLIAALCFSMIKATKMALAPALASLGVLAHWKGWHAKTIFFIDRAEKWLPGIKNFEGGYYEVYRLLSIYKLEPEPNTRSLLLEAISTLNEHIPDDPEMIESLDMLVNKSKEQLGNAIKT